ncbi:MAG: helix-turn-helix domain-containing protein [Alphaproteobacteria bacterium]
MNTTPSQTKKPNWIDSYVGSRVRVRRKMLSMSQEKLGEKLGITFQQVQKYEKGTNRIGASRLFDVSRLLQVPISFFFPDPDSGSAVPGMSEDSSRDFVMDSLSTAEGVELNRLFSQIAQPRLRRKVIELVRVLKESEAA